MNQIIAALKANPQVTDYKINIHHKKSIELFFVKGKLETIRCTDTCDQEVRVYAAHDGCLGDAQFFVYPSTTEEMLPGLISEAVAKALLIHNKPYDLPQMETGSFEVPGNFLEYEPEELTARIAKDVFAANTLPNGSLNSVEVFVYRHTERIVNSRGLDKLQVRYEAMVEAIPTYNGQAQSVELYEQYNFGAYDPEALRKQIRDKMLAVKARYEAVKPETPLSGKIVLNKLELGELFDNVVYNMRYSTVHSDSSMFAKGDMLQKALTGDPLTITMEGKVEGCIGSSEFDSDGLQLKNCTIVKDGQVVNYFGANRYGQYLGVQPTGMLRCICVEPGSWDAEAAMEEPWLEVVSMSGLQVDFFSDYIGGEVRLAYYHKDGEIIPVTGISIAGSLEKALGGIRLSKTTSMHDNYVGPEKALLSDMNIF